MTAIYGVAQSRTRLKRLSSSSIGINTELKSPNSVINCVILESARKIIHKAWSIQSSREVPGQVCSYFNYLPSHLKISKRMLMILGKICSFTNIRLFPRKKLDTAKSGSLGITAKSFTPSQQFHAFFGDVPAICPLRPSPNITSFIKPSQMLW